MDEAHARRIPSARVRQLKAGGRMILPRGEPAGSQKLILIEKEAHGEVSLCSVLPVRFVPLTGPGNQSVS